MGLAEWKSLMKASQFNYCLLRDDINMTSTKIVHISRPPPPFSVHVQNSSTPLALGVQFQTNPSFSK